MHYIYQWITGDIVVCSKHSTGDRIDDNESDKTTTASNGNGNGNGNGADQKSCQTREFELLQQFDGDQQKLNN